MGSKSSVADRTRTPDAGAWVVVALSLLSLLSGYAAPSQAIAVERAGVLLGIAGAVGAFMLVGGRRGARPSRVAIAWAAFLGWALIASLASGRVWSAMTGEPNNLLGFLPLVLLTALAWAANSRGEAIGRALSSAAVWVVGLESLMVVGQLAAGDAPAGTLPNSTYLGQAIVVLLPFACADRWRPRWMSQARCDILGAAAVAILAASGSRVAAVVAAVWLVWRYLRAHPAGGLRRAAAVVGVVALVVASALAFARVEALGSAGIATLGERPTMLRTAVRATLERPLTGFGPDGFLAGGAAVTTPELARSADVLVFSPGAVDPHNLIAWVAVSTGIVGLVLFAWALFELTSAWRQAADRRAFAPAIWSVMGALVIFMTAPAAVQVLPVLALSLGVSMGAAFAGRIEARGTVGRILFVSAAALVAVVGLALVADLAGRMAIEQHGADVSTRKLGTVEAVSAAFPFDPHVAHLASLHYGWASAADPAVAATQPDLAAIERATRLDHRDPFIALEAARTRRFYRAPDAEVEAAFEEALRRWPLYPLARAEYAIFLAQRGRDEEARSQLDVATLVEPGRDAELANAIAQARDLIGE